MKEPSTIKNFIYGMFKYYPVKPVKNKLLLDIPIYCISLTTATSRKKFMLKQIRMAGFKNFIFFDAIDAKKINRSNLIANNLYDDSLANYYHNRSLSNGEIACSLSHGSVYELIVKDNHDFSLILEDDAIFLSEQIDLIDLSALPGNWDVVFLSSFYLDRPPAGHIYNNLYTTQSWNGSCAAYIISNSGAKKLASSYLPVIHAADGFVGRSIKCEKFEQNTFKQKGTSIQLNTYLYYPDPILNGSSVGFWSTSLPAFLNK